MNLVRYMSLALLMGVAGCAEQPEFTWPDYAAGRDNSGRRTATATVPAASRPAGQLPAAGTPLLPGAICRLTLASSAAKTVASP